MTTWPDVWKAFFDALKVVGPAFITATVALFSAFFAYNWTRNKERRERRLKALEDAHAEVARAIESIHKLRLKIGGGDKDFDFLQSSWKEALPESTPWRIADALELLGFYGCGTALLCAREAHVLALNLSKGTDPMPSPLKPSNWEQAIAWEKAQRAYFAALDDIKAAHRRIEAEGIKEAFADWIAKL